MFVHRGNINRSAYANLGLYRRLRELIESGKDFKPRKVFDTDSEAEAIFEEKRRIDNYGLDNLFNSTNVMGPTTLNWPKARSQAISKALKERAKKNRLIYGTGLPPEHRANIGRHQRGIKKPWLSEQLRRAHASGKMDHVQTIFQQAGTTAWKGKHHSAESKQKLSLAHDHKPRPVKFMALIKKCSWVSSKFKGVSRTVRRGNEVLWQASITVNKKQVSLGARKDEVQAAILYDNALEDICGVRFNQTNREDQIIPRSAALKTFSRLPIVGVSVE